MAPKPAAALVPVAGGGVASGLRSAAKTAPAPAKVSSNSKVAPVKAAAAAKTKVPAKSVTTSSKSSKGNALSNTAPAASNGGRAAMSPPPSVNLFGNIQVAVPASKKKGKPKPKAQQQASDAAVENIQQPVELSLLNAEALFEMFVAEVPTFERFRAQWSAIGSLSAQVVATQYEPETFVADIIRDLSTPTLNLDRPTATQVASFFAWHVENDDSFPYAVRRPWVLLKCRLRREAIPELYSQATVDRYAKEAAADRKLKRKRVVDNSSGSNGVAAAAAQSTRQSSDSNDNSSTSSESSEADSSESDSDAGSDDDAPTFAAIQKQKDLNAVTVWGEKAGFSVIPHEQILQMLADKAADVSRRGQDAPRGVAVVFPKLSRWNKASWLFFERKWWISINEAVENGSYSKIVSLIDLDLHVDIQLDLKLSATELLKCTDVEFLRRAHGWFGPTDNEQAKLLLDTHQCRDNGNGNPSFFLKSLSAYNTAVLRTLDIEIAPSVSKWPKRGERKHGPLTIKSIRSSFKNGFSADKSISAACKHCFNVCEQNPKWSHNKLYRELRDHFLEDEKALQRSTMVGSKRGGSDNTESGGRGNQNKRQRGESSGPQSAGGNPRDRGPKSDRSSGTKPKQEHQFKIVKGADRGKVCGDYTNHYGKGCSAKTCIYFGTEHAKPKGYVWKDSDKEAKVTIDQQAFYDLKKAKADVVKFNNENREAYRNANKGQHYPSSSSAALDTLVIIDPSAVGKQLSTQQLVNHLGLAYGKTPPSAADLGELVAMDLVNVDADSCDTASPLEELGWSRRFYGVAAFLPALQPPVSATSNSETSLSCASLWFARDVQEGKYKRAARFTKGIVKPSSCVNVINASAVALASQYGKLKECLGHPPPIEVVSDGRPYIHLQFDVAVGAKAVVTKTDWFVIDADNKQPARFVVTLKATFADVHNISANAFELVAKSDCTIANAADQNPAPIVAAEHQQFIGKVFFDPGAQMSCISEHLVVPHLCLDAKAVDASIVQMGVVVAHCTKAVLMDFKLFDAQMKPVRYQEWFLVFNNPYGIVMGELFCQQFTTWRQLLASWDDANVHHQLGLSAENFTGWMAQNAPEDNSAVSSSMLADSNVSDANRFVSRHPVTNRPLRCRDAGSRPIIGSSDHTNFRLNDSNVAPGVWTESSRRAFDAQRCLAKEKRLYGLLEKLPEEARVAVDVAELQDLFAEDQRSLCLRIQREIVGLPVGLMMGCGQSGIVRRSHLFEPYKPTLVSDDSATDVKALSPAMCFFVRDLIAAHIEALQTGRMRPWRADVEQKQFDSLEVAEAPQVKVNVPPLHKSDVASSFAPGTIIRFQNCSRLPHFNDKLGRLYDETEVPGVWRIRMLGKDGGQFVKSNVSHFVVHEMQRPFVSSVDANFHDVGLDDAGMPIEAADDMPKPVHRQFGKEYSAELTAKIKDILARFPQLFDGDISEQCTFEEMDIQLKSNAILPSKSRYYRNTPRMKEEVRRQVQEQLEMGIISKAQTAVVSNVLLVKRPHMPGRYRFVVDFRDVNDVTVPEMLMMPDIKSQHDRLSNKNIYGAVDISSYYRLIGLKKECRYLTGFATDEGTFVYNRVPMGVRNACSHAQRVLQDALAADPVLGVQGANIRNYFDDIAWGSKTEEEFLVVLEALMEFGVTHKLKFNAEKSCFGVDSITHVGFVVSKDGVKIDPERTRDIVDMQSPKSTKKVQSVLGVLNFVRNFVPGFSLKAKFLTDRLEKSAAKRDEKKFIWSEDDERQFRELKELVLTAPLLSVLDYSAPIFIRCDSSRYGAGAVLFQYDNEGREVPVCYASRKYTATETRYSTFQQEMGAVVWALERFQEYCMGYPVIVETDHRNISYVKRSAMPQLARWRMRLEAFDFEVHYRCGALQQVADGLSRAACDEEGIDAVAIHYRDVLPECALANAAPAEALGIMHIDAVDVLYNENDSTLSSAWNADACRVNVDVLPISDESALPSIESDSDDDDDDIGTAASDEASHQAPDLPWHDAAAVKDILNSVHNDLAGHGGVLVTLQRVLKLGKPSASRKQMLQDIDAFLMGCVSCQKMRKRSSGSAVTRRVISGNPFEELSIDILKLPFPDAHGNMYVVTIVDNFSHWISTYACANKSAVCAVRALLQHIGVFGVPLRIRSDGGGEFCNDIVVQLTRLMGSAQMVVLPYAHTANGIAERANRSILERLRFILFDRRIKKQPKLQWSDLLPLAQRIVNSSVHSAIGTSPSRLIFGDHVDIDRCILTKPAVPLHNKLVVDYVQQLSDMQFAMIDAANNHQIMVQDKVIAKAARQNQGKPQRQLQIGDLVLIKPLKDVPMHKLAPRELGPRTIVEFNDGGIVTLSDPHSLKLSKASETQCELFDTSLVDTVEGQRCVAETDAFEFAVEAILAHGIGGDDDLLTGEIAPLGSDHKRTLRPLNYAFLIKWAGYEQPTWVAYKAARLLPHFANYVDGFPNLRMGSHA